MALRSDVGARVNQLRSGTRRCAPGVDGRDNKPGHDGAGLGDFGYGSDAFQDHRDALTDADAHGAQRVAAFLAA
jgi:hypothetical protein